MFYYTYILKSKKDGKLYTGSMNDLRKRLDQHNNGMNESETQSYINNIKNGRINPVRGRGTLRALATSNGMNPTLSCPSVAKRRRATLEKIAKALGVSSDELLK